jgi:multiple sugar transport system substrate-binding protein
MKKPKNARLLSFLFLLLFIPMLSGCSSVFSFQQQPVTITIWHYYTAGLEKSFGSLVDEFNKSYGQKHNIIVQTQNKQDVDTLASKVVDSSKKAVGADPLPNIIFAYTGTVFTLDQMGMVVDLNNYFSQSDLQKYYPSFIEEGRIGAQNKLESFPVAKSTELLFINKADFNEFAQSANVSGLYGTVFKDDFSTFEGIARLADAYYKWTDAKTPSIPNDGKSFFGMDSTPNFVSVGLRQLGDQPVTVSGSTGAFSIDKTAAKRLWDYYYNNMLTGRFAEIGNYRADDMKTGDLVCYLGSSGGATYFPQEITPDSNTTRKTDLLVMPYPVFAGAKAVTIQQGAGMSVIRSDKQHEEAAAEFIKWFTSPEQNVQFSYMSGYQPVQKAEYIKDAQAKELSELKAGADITEQNTLQALEVASNQFEHYDLTVDKEYTGSFDVRNMFGATLFEAAKGARKSLLADLTSGKTLEQSLPSYLNNARSESWFQDIQKQFAELTGQ